jgi:phosphoglycolate phosphatase
MKKLIIFDLDGVLLDSEQVATESLLEQYPMLTPQDQKELLAGNYHEEIAKIRELHGKIIDEEEREIRRANYAAKKLGAPMFDGAVELLQDLHALKYIIALNTSAAERNSLPLLEKNGILHLFDFLGTAEISKSKVEKFKIIEDKYNLTNKETIFVTDTLGDLREADIAGVPTVCVTWGAHDHTYFGREPHKNLLKIVDTMAELKEILT